MNTSTYISAYSVEDLSTQERSLIAAHHRTSLDSLLKVELRNAARNKWLLIYFAFFVALSEGLFRFTGMADKVFVTLMSIMTIVVPLISIMFSVMQVYNTREFTELLLSQPVRRSTVFVSSFLATSLPLVLSFCVGAGIPLLAHSFGDRDLIGRTLLLLVNGALLTCSFSALAFAIATKMDERAKGFGASLMVWFFCAVVYDGLFLFLLYALSDYPTERFALVLSFLNPIDLSRIMLSLVLDQSALMGYTGAIYKQFFGSWQGMSLALSVLTMWAIIPVIVARRTFLRKDF